MAGCIFLLRLKSEKRGRKEGSTVTKPGRILKGERGRSPPFKMPRYGEIPDQNPFSPIYSLLNSDQRRFLPIFMRFKGALAFLAHQISIRAISCPTIGLGDSPTAKNLEEQRNSNSTGVQRVPAANLLKPGIVPVSKPLFDPLLAVVTRC